MAQAVPYLTEQQVRDKYAKALADYTNQRNAEADRERASVNSNYDNTQRQNYVQYMQNKRDLPEQMARMGVSGGGASETSALRAQTNYENLYNNTERSRNSDIGKINNTLADTLNTYRMTADQNMNDEIAQNRQLRANYEKQLQQEAEQRFANTISGYDSISEIDSLIKSISKKGVDTWRIPYLRARRAELAAALAEQQAAASSGGGGGGGGYSYRYNGGGGGGTPVNNDIDYNNVAANAGRVTSSLASARAKLNSFGRGGSTKKTSSSSSSATRGWNASKPKSGSQSYRNSKKGSSRRHGLW